MTIKVIALTIKMRGDSSVKEKRKQIIVRAEQSEYERIRKAAEQDRRSVSQYMVMASIERAEKEAKGKSA